MRYLFIAAMVLATATLALAQTVGLQPLEGHFIANTSNSIDNNTTANPRPRLEGAVREPQPIRTVVYVVNNNPPGFANNANTANMSNTAKTTNDASTTNNAVDAAPPAPSGPAFGDNIRTMRSDKDMFSGKPQY